MTLSLIANMWKKGWFVVLVTLFCITSGYGSTFGQQPGPVSKIVLDIEDGELIFTAWKGDNLAFLVRREEHISRTEGEGDAIVIPIDENTFWDWYQYDPLTDTLEKLDQSPYLESDLSQELLIELDLCPYEGGLHHYVRQSPSGNILLFEKNMPDDYGVCPSEITHLEEGVSVELDYMGFSTISQPDFWPLYEILWSMNEMEFVVRSYGFGSSADLVSLSGNNAVVTPLYPSPIWEDFPHGYPIIFRDAAISPSGRYILTSVEQYRIDFALFDQRANALTLLDNLGTRYSDAIWLDDEIFLAVTRQGIVLYDIIDATFDTLISDEEFNQDQVFFPQHSEPVFSPGGEFLFLAYREEQDVAGEARSYLVSIDLRDLLAESYGSQN